VVDKVIYLGARKDWSAEYLVDSRIERRADLVQYALSHSDTAIPSLDQFIQDMSYMPIRKCSTFQGYQSLKRIKATNKLMDSYKRYRKVIKTI
jgi:hypothetical protein